MPVINRKKKTSEFFNLLDDYLPPLKDALYDAFMRIYEDNYYGNLFPKIHFPEKEPKQIKRIRGLGEYPVYDDMSKWFEEEI